MQFLVHCSDKFSSDFTHTWRPPLVVEHLDPVAARVEVGVDGKQLGVAVAEPGDLKKRMKAVP